MSSGHASRPGSRNSKRSASDPVTRQAPAPTLTPENLEGDLKACAATQHLFLCAQRNVILCLRHDTLTIEHRLKRHKEDVLWICVDNTSERGSGQLMVSYDAGHTAIVWDLHTGKEISRFAAYERLLCASFLRNGNIVFGGVQGNLVLFEPSTSEHYTCRLIFDPVTAIAPSWDCRHFACGFMNGSILICKIQPSFVIVHTLSMQKGPSKVTGIQWHGSSQKSKTDMLATQTGDGDMRVWSVPKVPNGDPCTTIRVLSESQGITAGPTWFAWSRNGRIVQFIDKETRLYDVRTKNIVMSRVPATEDIVGITNYASSSSLFILTSKNFIQQWNLNPDGEPILVRVVQHVPANPPPSPPGSREPSHRSGQTLPPVLPSFTDSDTSGDESREKSPLRRVVRAIDADEEQERRDALGPLSPTSSRSSNSSGRSSRRKLPPYLYDKPESRSSSSSRDSYTEFSSSQALPQPRDSGSIRSGTSYRSSLLRREVMRSPESPRNPGLLDLFPYTNARLCDLPFRTPDYGNQARTPDVLRKEMLRVVFGWGDDIKPLIRDELQRHPPGSSRAVLLLKWLGELGSDSIVSIMGSQAMTSSDWMLLALSSIGKDSQKKAGDAFVQRLLEKGDIHPAVAILLGVGEHDEAIEAYVSQKCYMEALLLTCLILPSNWDRQCFLLRKWGEVAVKTGNPELAVRIFSCTSEETTGPWSSPRAQDAFFKAQNDRGATTTSPLSPGQSGRLTAKSASLKLITTFGDKGTALLPTAKSNDPTPMSTNGAAVTPIANSALSPGEQNAWFRKTREDHDPASAVSARTATPGSYGRQRQTSKGATPRIGTARTTPQTAQREFAPSPFTTPSAGPGSVHSRTHSHRPISSVEEEASQTTSPANKSSDRKSSDPNHLPSPVAEALVRLRQDNHTRNGSRDRMPDGLHLDVIDTAFLDSALSPALPTQSTNQSGYSMTSSRTGISGASSPPLTAGSGKGRALEHYLSSLEQAGISPLRQHRPSSKARAVSRPRAENKARVESRARADSKSRIRRERSESRGRHEIKYIRAPKRSPSSPVAMSPDEVLAAMQARVNSQVPDKTDSSTGRKVGSRSQSRRARAERLSRPSTRTSNSGSAAVERGRSRDKTGSSASRSPSSPLPRSRSIGARRRSSKGDAAPAQASTPTRLQRSMSLSKATDSPRYPITPVHEQSVGIANKFYEEPSGMPRRTITPMSKKELAAKELEERRLSLARRPSAPLIPLPGESPISKRPVMGPRSQTELGDNPASALPPHISLYGGERSQSVDNTAMNRELPKRSGASTASIPIGLPANPRAMLHGRSMSFAASRREDSPILPPSLPLTKDTDGYISEGMLSPLLPSTTFGQPPALNRSVSVPLDCSNEQRLSIQTSHNTLLPVFRGDPFGHGQLRLQSNHVGSILPPTHQHSPPIVTASIDETIHESDVFIEEVSDVNPPLLPELQHLVEPPPPPPPPPPPSIPMAGSNSVGNSPVNARRSSLGHSSMLSQHQAQGDIAISLDSFNNTRTDSPTQPMERSFTASPPQAQRRGRGSISEVKSGFGSRIRSVTERMRSTSRSGKKSPPSVPQVPNTVPSPYETVLPYALNANGTGSRGASPVQPHQQPTSALARGHQRRDSVSSMRTKSPWDTHPGPNVLTGGESLGITYSRPGTAPGGRGTPSRPEDAVPQLANAAPGYVRNPKEIRANMPPDMFHQGAYVGPSQQLPLGGGGQHGRKPSINSERVEEEYVPEMI